MLSTIGWISIYANKHTQGWLGLIADWRPSNAQQLKILML